MQNDGAVALGTTRPILGVNAGGRGVYRMNGGTLRSAGEFSVGSKGTGEFIQTGGNVTFAGCLNLGRNGG